MSEADFSASEVEELGEPIREARRRDLTEIWSAASPVRSPSPPAPEFLDRADVTGLHFRRDSFCLLAHGHHLDQCVFSLTMEYYFSCRQCGALNDPCHDPFRPDLDCCPRPVPDLWPPADALKLLDIARGQLLERAEGRRVAAVFLAFAFERLLEEALVPLAPRGGLPPDQRERQKVLEVRTGTPVHRLLAEAGLPGFHRDWKQLIRLRNQVAHGRFTLDQTMDGSVLDRLHSDAIPAFVHLARAARSAQRTRRGSGEKTASSRR